MRRAARKQRLEVRNEKEAGNKRDKEEIFEVSLVAVAAWPAGWGVGRGGVSCLQPSLTLPARAEWGLGHRERMCPPACLGCAGHYWACVPAGHHHSQCSPHHRHHRAHHPNQPRSARRA